VRSRASSFK